MNAEEYNSHKNLLPRINALLNKTHSQGLNLRSHRFVSLHGVPFYSDRRSIALHPAYEFAEASLPSENASRADVYYTSEEKPQISVHHAVPHITSRHDGETFHHWNGRKRTVDSFDRIMGHHNFSEDDIKARKLDEPDMYDFDFMGNVSHPVGGEPSTRFKHSSEVINHFHTLPGVGYKILPSKTKKTLMNTPGYETSFMNNADLSRHTAAFRAFPLASDIDEHPIHGFSIDPHYYTASGALDKHDLIHVKHVGLEGPTKHYAYNPHTEQLHQI